MNKDTLYLIIGVGVTLIVGVVILYLAIVLFHYLITNLLFVGLVLGAVVICGVLFLIWYGSKDD
jgi:hypothetical protein